LNFIGEISLFYKGYKFRLLPKFGFELQSRAELLAARNGTVVGQSYTSISLSVRLVFLAQSRKKPLESSARSCAERWALEEGNWLRIVRPGEGIPGTWPGDRDMKSSVHLTYTIEAGRTRAHEANSD
jgi:hypothetical protein